MYQRARLMISLSPVVLGTLMLFGVLPNIAANYSTTNWPKVLGVVSEVKSTGVLSYYRKESYISYRYEVNGNEFFGNRVYFGGGSTSDYYTGQTVDVFYNPNKYNEAVLEVGLRSGNLLSLTLGAGLIVAGKLLWKRLG